MSAHDADSTAGSFDRRPMVLEPTRNLRFLDFEELWRYRELAYFLTWRNVKVRYKQTAIGVAWAVLQPLAMMAVFTVFFGKFINLQKDVEIPYHLFAYAGVLPWQLFSRVLSESSNSLVKDQRLISKVYFPRVLVPFASCTAALVDFIIGFVLLIGLMALSGVYPSWTIIYLPFYLLLMLVAALGIGFWLSALNTQYRDVGYVIPFLVQFWMFASPVVYPSSIVPDRYQWLLGLNPMTSVLEGIRWSMFGVGSAPRATLLISAVICVAVFVSGIYWFRWHERTFVDSLGGQ